MTNLKRLMFFGVMFVSASVMVMGQVFPAQGMTVEESYLQESIELLIIREQSRSASRDMKLLALEYIGDLIERGNRSAELHASLEFLAMEGVRNQTRESRRLVNNFPDVRLRTATRLGQMGTPEARDILMNMLLADNEPTVIAEAIRSLGIIGLNENGETANAISWVVARFDVINPHNILAFSALDAYQRLAVANDGVISASTVNAILRIAEGNYLAVVRERARALLTEFRSFR